MATDLDPKPKKDPEQIIFKWIFVGALLIEGLKFLWFLVRG